MKLDTSVKRAGLVLIIFSIGVFLLIGIIKIFAEPQLVAYHMQNGRVLYLQRGAMENMVLHWIETALIIFPLFACGIILLLGKGGSLVQWIIKGPKEKDSEDKTNKTSQGKTESM